MQLHSRISFYYTRRQSDIIALGHRVIEKMENNPIFSNPPQALAELKLALPEFQTALANARGRDKEMVSIKNDKKLLVLTLLEELAVYITATCKRDRTLMLSSGFEVSNEKRGGKKLPDIDVLEVKLGLSGDVTIRTRNVTGAKAYIHQFSSEPPGSNTHWFGEGSTQRHYKFTGLQSDKRYWFRIVVLGSNNQKVYSPVVSRVIQ
jgi:hypothetical protein